MAKSFFDWNEVVVVVFFIVFLFVIAELSPVWRLIRRINVLYDGMHAILEEEEKMKLKEKENERIIKEQMEKINVLSGSLLATQNLLKEVQEERMNLLETNDHMLVTLDKFQAEAKSSATKIGNLSRKITTLEKENENMKLQLRQYHLGMTPLTEMVSSSSSTSSSTYYNNNNNNARLSGSFHPHLDDESTIRNELGMAISDTMFEAHAQSHAHQMRLLANYDQNTNNNQARRAPRPISTSNVNIPKNIPSDPITPTATTPTTTTNDLSSSPYFSNSRNNSISEGEKKKDVRMKYYMALVSPPPQ